MKIYPNRVRITLYFLIAILCLGVVIYLALLKWFLSPWGAGQIIVTACYLAMGTTLFIINMKSTFYVMSSNYFSFYRWGKETRYFYNDIVYINQDKGNMTATIELYHTKYKEVYLTCDSGTVLYDELIKKCKKVLNKDEFILKYKRNKGGK